MKKSLTSNLTPIATAVGLMVLSVSMTAQAQDAAKVKAAEVQEVQVVGVRAAQEKSINIKRNSDAHVDVISAEDIGKMPDKNVADSLARVPGVNVSNAVAGEGGFDERDRVGLRGTSPSLTQTLVNGHSIANGDWFILSQVGSGVGRSVSFALLPSELVSRVIVRKSSEASLVEGGTAGSVDIISRKPLDFKEQVTMEAGIGAVYSTLPGKTDPQLSALMNYKNDTNTFGVMVQAFSEKRSLRRDGVETLSYDQIDPNSAMAKADPNLAGVFVPRSIGAALFQQERKRTGGLVALQLKPNKDVDLSLTGFSSKMDASNYNNNYLFMVGNVINKGAGQAPDAGYVVTNTNGVKTLTSATFSPKAGVGYGEIDPISRPDSTASSNFINLDGKFRVNSDFVIKTQLGTSKGEGTTPTQNVVQLNANGSGGMYKLNGVNSAPSFNIGLNPSSNNGLEYGWSWGNQGVAISDKEDWLHLDGEYSIDAGVLQGLKFGVRTAKHDRHSGQNIGQGPACSDTHVVDWGSNFNCNNGAASPFNPANLPAQGSRYPSNFGSGLGSGFPVGVNYYTPEQLAAQNALYTRRDLPGRRDWGSEYKVAETTTAAYLQGDLAGEGWSGNVGVRAVKTKSTAGWNVPVPSNAPGAITTSAFGPFVATTSDHDYTDYLPSASFRFDLNRDMIARVAVSKTMTRSDYTALAGAVNLTPPKTTNDVGSGSAGNADLKPIRSNNLDFNLEYYFAKRAFASAGAYYMDMESYVTDGTFHGKYVTALQNSQTTYMADYLLTGPVNVKAKVKGIELAFEMPIMDVFGINANYTYADGSDENNHVLKGMAKHTLNLGAFYEQGDITARLNYGYRSDMYVGQDRGYDFSQLAGATVSASLGYKINDHLALSLDAQNLNNPTLKYFGANADQPRSIYTNGRQYYLTARIKY
jgi:iron complex outermembrane receptor protein